MGNVKRLRAKQRRRAKITKNIATLVIVVGIISVITTLLELQIRDLNRRFQKQSQKIEAVQEQINEEQRRMELLTQRENYMKTKEYIEDIAKEKLGLVYPDEILLKPAQ